MGWVAPSPSAPAPSNMPSRSRESQGGAPVRQSPRKRKVDEIAATAPCDATLPEPARHELQKADVDASDSPKSSKRNTRKANVVLDEPARSEIAKQGQEQEEEDVGSSGAQQLNGGDCQDTSSELSSVPEDEEEPEKKSPKPRKKRKTKEQKEAEKMPLAPRTTGLTHYVGAHVSIAKGVENAITNAVHIGGNALALFLQSQRKWENPELKPENQRAFISACSHHQYDAKQHIVPHGSYLVNLAGKGAEQGKKSYDFFLNDLKRCEALGIRYYNFHPGATNGEPLSEAIDRLSANLNRALSETTTVTPLLENMAGTESIIGSRLTDLADVIARIAPEYQQRIGICIDTCHTFAAGYDLRTPEAFQKTFKQIDDTIGLRYLKAMHLNDSKGMFGSKKDLHQNIGLGFLGLRAFHSIMNEPRLANIPLILETPCERVDPDDAKKKIEDKSIWSKEIKLLESLIGMDPESHEYKQLEQDLADRGREEREKMLKWQADKDKKERAREEKVRKKLEKAGKGQQSIAGMFSGKAGKKKTTMERSPSPSSDSE